MGIIALFSADDLQKRFEKKIAALERAIIRRLSYLGEQCVNMARANGDYLDRTGNLRSSIGYVVFANGMMVKEGFDESIDRTGYTVSWTNLKSKKEHSKKVHGSGIEKGRNMAKEIASKYSDGFVLVVVAGMEYALYVESKGRDVLTSSEQFANTQLPVMLNQLKLNLNS